MAEQAALLDQVSGGRFWLGVGRGGPWVDLEVCGAGPARYESGFAEGLDLLLAALASGSAAGTGPAFRFGEVPVVPRPRTRPYPGGSIATMPAISARRRAVARSTTSQPSAVTSTAQRSARPL